MITDKHPRKRYDEREELQGYTTYSEYRIQGDAPDGRVRKPTIGCGVVSLDSWRLWGWGAGLVASRYSTIITKNHCYIITVITCRRHYITIPKISAPYQAIGR